MEMKQYFRSDLMEEGAAHAGEGALPGVRSCKRVRKGVEVFETEVFDEEGAALTGKPIGRYITLTFREPWLMGEEEKEGLCAAVAAELEALLVGIPEDRPVLLVGLGNRRMTADAIGPAVESKILVTGHLEKLDPALFKELGHRAVCALSPGVLGDTGMESAEVTGAVAELLKPGVIMVVDALAAGSTARLCRTVQLSDAGISPGAGIGNDRPGFSRERFGVPVIAIGVPTVVDVSTLIADALEKAGKEELTGEIEEVIESGRGFFVSLKEVDAAVEELSGIVARAVDGALTRNEVLPCGEMRLC